MNRPERKNAMSREMREVIAATFRRAERDPTIRAIILTGAGDAFSTGGDIDGLMSVAVDEFRAYLAAGHELIRLVYGFPKPVVAAINGIGVGGGMALALAGDAIVMSDNARAGLPFLKIGFVPDWGTLHTLARRLGHARAASVFRETRIMNAAEALAIGLVDKVVPHEALQAAAVDYTTLLAQQAPAAFAATKRIMNELSGDLDRALALELDAQTIAFKGAEFREGVAAFKQRRPPDFVRQAGEES